MLRLLPLLAFLPACNSGVKTAALGVRLGESCTDARCQSGLVCSNDGICAQPGDLGTTVVGDDCTASQECEFGAVCASDNFCAEAGAAGTGADGEACDADDDCQAGHFCDDDGVCADIGIPWWTGDDCPADDGAEFYPYFNVPGSDDEGDFYSLPYPNDIRLDTSGRPEFVHFPDPGATVPAVAEVLAGLSGGITGYGLSPTVFFRFSQPQDIDTVRILTDDATVHWASLDEDAEDFGELGSLQYFTRHTRGKYICQNWLAVSVYDGAPLLEDHTYAVWLTKDIESESGDTAVRDNGFKVIMNDDRPSDVSLGRAWDAYAPFRDYVEAEDIDDDDIAGAALFTTGRPSQGVRYFREVTGDTQEISITASDLTLCPATSPCDDGGERACGTGEDGFREIHGRLSIPRYLGDDGAVSFEASLRPIVQSEEEVCFAMTLPPGTMPGAGWPVALYGGDTGGSFRDAASNGVAAYLAAKGFATLSLELPAHGARGTTYADPTHPTAWLGNQLQFAADPHAALRFVQEWSVDAAESPTGDVVRFDTDNVWFVGLGEGASIGVDFLAWSLDARGGVLGNPYGYEIHTLADQTEPVDLSHGLQAAFADSSLNRWHPMLNLLQQYFEPVDPVNAAIGMVREPAVEAKHVMIVHGVEDTEIPALSIQSLLRASHVPIAGTVLEEYGQGTTGSPAYENVTTDDGPRTAACVQVEAGHDALLEPDVMTRVAEFLDSGTGGSPTIEE